jgi:hypothetical protein
VQTKISIKLYGSHAGYSTIRAGRGPRRTQMMAPSHVVVALLLVLLPPRATAAELIAPPHLKYMTAYGSGNLGALATICNKSEGGCFMNAASEWLDLPSMVVAKNKRVHGKHPAFCVVYTSPVSCWLTTGRCPGSVLGACGGTCLSGKAT